MFILNEKRINIYAPYTDANGTRYANLTDPAIRASLGITEIADLTPPEDYSQDTYYRTEQDDAPYVVYTKKSDEQIAEQNRVKTNTESLAYLAETDWMVTRFAETGVPIPDAIKVARQAARDAVVPDPVQA